MSLSFNLTYYNNDYCLLEETSKYLIVLHDSYTKRSNGVKGVIDFWRMSGKKIFTPFVVDVDGTVYKIYDEIYWSYHTGLGRFYDLISIGITLVNEGPLVRKGKEWLTTFGAIYKGDVYCHNIPWRDYIYFASYTPEQVEAVGELVKYLTDEYSIERLLPKNVFDFSRDYFNFKGILFHCSLVYHRLDPSVAFPVNTFVQKANINYR